MGLDLEKLKGVSNIPNILKGQNVLIPTGYGTAATNQTESSKYKLITTANTWGEIYTVPAGKTWYVSTIIISSNVNVVTEIGTGAAASETAIFKLWLIATTLPAGIINLITPMKFTSGTMVSGRASTADDVHFTLVGWEE